jgi:hypothetical protein
MSTNGLNNEEALEENMRAGRGCLFLRCSSKQTTIRGGFQPLSVASTTLRSIPVGRVVEGGRGGLSRSERIRILPISDCLPRVLDWVKWGYQMEVVFVPLKLRIKHINLVLLPTCSSLPIKFRSFVPLCFDNSFTLAQVFYPLFSVFCILLRRNRHLYNRKDALSGVSSKLRGLDSNQRPPGYEPDELPLLYPATGRTSGYCITPARASQGLR